MSDQRTEFPKTEEGFNPTSNSEIKIVGVDVTEYNSGIPLRGFDSVASALRVFASGKIRGSGAAHLDLVMNVSKLGPAAVDLVLRGEESGDTTFVDNLLQEAESGIKRDGKWQKGFDYDAMGTPFFKTGVRIEPMQGQEDVYLLSLYGLRGEEMQKGLAETLGVEEALTSRKVEVVLEPQGENSDRFEIDFDQIAQRLQGLYGELQSTGDVQDSGSVSKLTGEKIVKTFSSGKAFVLGIKDGIKVVLKLGSGLGDGQKIVRNRSWVEGPWKTTGSVVSGLLSDSLIGPGFSPPSISFLIYRPSGELTTDPKIKSEMNDLASKIASAFSRIEKTSENSNSGNISKGRWFSRFLKK